MKNDYHEIFKIFGKNVKLCRTSLNWSQKDLATESDISLSIIGPLERGERTLAFITVYAICQALGVTIDKMLLETSVIDLINTNPSFSQKVNGKPKTKTNKKTLKKGR